MTGWKRFLRRLSAMVRISRNATLKTLNEKSPRGMVVTLKLLRLARASSSLEECLVREYRAALKCLPATIFAKVCARP